MKNYLLILLIGIFGCASNSNIHAFGKKKSQKPKWVTNLKSVYSDSRYMSAIGEGDTQRQAQQSAAGNISNIFESKITVDQTVQESYLELTKNKKTNTEISSSINTNINIQSIQSIKNIQFGESYTNNMGRVLVVAYLDRMKTGEIYTNEIEENIKKINSYIANSDNQTKFKKYSYLKAALVVAKMNQSLIDKLQIISSHQVDFIEVDYDINVITELVNEASQDLEFRITIENDDNLQMQNVIEEVLLQKGFSISESGDYHLSGELDISRIDLQRKQKFVRWEFNLKMTDSSGNIVFSFNKKNREGHINYSEAEARAVRTVQKAIRKGLVSDIDAYTNNLLN